MTDIQLREEIFARANGQCAPPPKHASLSQFSVEELLAPIDPERYLLPAVPTSAYSIIGGALSSYKSTLLIYLALWRATNHDLLDLEPEGAGIDTGPVLMLGYEDADARVIARFQRIVQSAHARIREIHGAKTAGTFLANIARHISRWPLVGNASATFVRRSETGSIEPNPQFIDALLANAKSITESGLLITADPLRLAVVGSQNDDDVAAVAVHTLNHVANAQPDYGVLVVSHATKADARGDAGNGYADAAYATAGSALYSQHARSNFRMARLAADDAREFLPPDANPQDIARQPVARLTHGRLSYGTESVDRHFQMQGGILVPVRAQEAPSLLGQMLGFLGVLAEVLESCAADGVRASPRALEDDGRLRAIASRDQIRSMLTRLAENGFVEFSGKTSDRICSLSEKGRAAPKMTATTNRARRRKGRT